MNRPLMVPRHMSCGGFALPTVLLTAVIMMIVLVSGMAASGTIQSGLRTQHYNQLAREAAESAVVYATSCTVANGYVAVWATAGHILSPDRDCNGNTHSSYSKYLVDTSTVRTTFTVDSAAKTSTGIFRFAVTGKVELMRASGGVWKTYTSTLARNLSIAQLMATKSTSGYYQVCGILNGNTWCWGRNDYGQLGDGTTNQSLVPVKVKRSGNLAHTLDTDISIGDMDVCMISGGDVYCWGKNHYGELGLGYKDDSAHPIPTNASQGSILENKTVTDITVNGRTACAVAGGNYYCWGSNWRYAFGTGNSADSFVPVQGSVIGTTYGKPVTRISSSVFTHFQCAVAAGKVYCWGDNELGQLGDGTTTNRSVPTPVATDTGLAGKTVIDVVTGGNPLPTNNPSLQPQFFACALTADGEMYCWGTNLFGQLGDGTHGNTYHTKPVKVSGVLTGKHISDIGVGFVSACALADNTVYCWGQNGSGQVGDGTHSDRYTPTPVLVQSPGLAGKTITDVLAGASRGCAVASGSTYCWGSNSQGQIGNGTVGGSYNVPTESTFLRPPPTLNVY